MFVETLEQTEIPPRSFGTFYDKFIHVYGIDKSRFVMMVVERSKGQATLLKLPQYSTEAALRASDECTLLKHLTFDWFEDDLPIFKDGQILPEVIGKWKFLESFCFGVTLLHIAGQLRNRKYFSRSFRDLLTLPEMEGLSCDNVLERIIVQIGTHCKHFRKLNLIAAHLRQVEALAIVNFLPQIQTILAFRCIIERDSLLTTGRGCKELLLFHAMKCAGFEVDDEGICKLASEAGKIVCEECVLHDARIHAVLGILVMLTSGMHIGQ